MSAAVTRCEGCQREVAEEELAARGACPYCGTPPAGGGEENRPVPWTFKLMIAATVVYLGFRAFQGIAWVVHHA